MTTPKPTGSQTLSRGLTALELLAEADSPTTIGELADRLGLHRSITYRIVRTLEQHRLVVRNNEGGLELGVRLAALARNVAHDLQSAALPELTAVANELSMTAFVTVLDHETSEAVTLTSVEPRHARAVVAQRSGNRHSIEHGAPGRAIRRQLQPDAGGAPYAISHDEVIPGLSSIAVPLAIPFQPPAAVAVVYLTGPVDVDAIGARLARASEAIRTDLT